MATRPAQQATIMFLEGANVALVIDLLGEIWAYEVVAVTDGHVVHTPNGAFNCREEVRFEC